MPTMVIHQAFLWSESHCASGISAFEIQNIALSPEDRVTCSPLYTSGREVSAFALLEAEAGPARSSHPYKSCAWLVRHGRVFPQLQGE